MNTETCFGDFILMFCMIENKAINKMSNAALSCLEVNNLISELNENFGWFEPQWDSVIHY